MTTPKRQSGKRTVKAWAAINAANDNLLAYGTRRGDWTYAVSAHKRALEAMSRKAEELVVRRYVPCTITYSPLPAKDKQK